MNRHEQKRAKEINLKELFKVIKRRLWIIVIVTVIAGMVGVITDKSKSTATIRIYQTSSRIIIGADAESRKTLQVIVKDPTILDKVIKVLKLDTTAEALADRISVASVQDSQIVSISVIDKDPVVAAKIADTTAEIFTNQVPIIVGQDYVRLLSKAKVNSNPINQEGNKNVYIFIIGGLVIGFGIAFLIESLDDKIRSEQEIESLLGLQVLGKVSKVSKRKMKKGKNKQVDLESRGETIGYK